jgi:HTH-type transcriptional regulator, competence development regulator
LLASTEVNEEDGMAAKELGLELRAVRELKGLSLAAVAEPAGGSATYLQKLERGEVESPSPHRLHALSQQLGVSYTQLMELAGYVVPRDDDAPRENVSLLAQAFSAEDLSDEELADLAEYLAFRRQRARHRT